MRTNTHAIPKIVIYGHVGYDISVTPSQEVKTIGGAAYYATLSASLLSRSAAIVTVVGRDFPMEQLHSLGIDMRGVVVRDGFSAAFLQKYDSDHKVVDFRAMLNVCEELSSELIPVQYFSAGIFFVATAPAIQQGCILARLREAKYTGLVAIDTTLAYVGAFRPLLLEYKEIIHIVFVNQEEFQALNWSPPRTMTVVVKRGAAGASLWREGVWTNVPAPIVDQVCNTTGAGDILAGACLAALASGCVFSVALLRGVQLATKSVTNPSVEHLRRTNEPPINERSRK